MNKILLFLLSLCYATLLLAQSPIEHIVLLGDPHLPGKNLEQKEHVLQTINAWNDVSMVVGLGDLSSKTGTKEDYASIKNYFDKLKHPFYPVNGNHDYIYTDELDGNGKLQHAPLEQQMEKLERFKSTFKLPSLYYSMIKEPFLLIFLSADNPKHLTELSKEQLSWLNKELKTHQNKPTIVFFHGPLEQTLDSYKHFVNTPNFIAQPADKIKSLLSKHPQLFLWVSGHTHTPATEPSFASSINRYENSVTNIHNTDMNKETIWTNSLFLYPDKVTIKTYNHATHTWLESLERHINIPKF